jgi:anti-sigma regulatory factor (Ser/Thr protein kinase)
VRLAIASEPAHLSVVRAALERFCELAGLGEHDRGQVVLAVDEALTNVIRHAYHGQSGKPIEIMFGRVADGAGGASLRIQLRDWGEQAPAGRIRGRDLQELRPGGLGVHIMRQCMDEVDYQPRPEGGTCLTLTKRLSQRVGA